MTTEKIAPCSSPDGSQPDSNRPLTPTLFKAGVEHLKNLYKCRRCGADLVVQFRMENSYEPVYGCQTCNPIEEDEVTNHTPVPGFTTFTLADRNAIRAEVLAEVDAVMKKWEMGDWGESFYQFVVQLRREIAALGGGE